jgi:hypothetical protein
MKTQTRVIPCRNKILIARKQIVAASLILAALAISQTFGAGRFASASKVSVATAPLAKSDVAKHVSVSETYGKLPLIFEDNKG